VTFGSILSSFIFGIIPQVAQSTSSSVPEGVSPPTGKIVLELSTKNVPDRYSRSNGRGADIRSRSSLAEPATPTLPSDSTADMSGSSQLFDPEESMRIRIFEQAAPSVVFLDTFTEKSDVFSTDV